MGKVLWESVLGTKLRITSRRNVVERKKICVGLDRIERERERETKRVSTSVANSAGFFFGNPSPS